MAESSSEQPSVGPLGTKNLQGLSSEEKRALLKRLTAGKSALPLLEPQRSLWFLEQLDPEAAHYNLMFAWRLQGKLDEAALYRAFNRLVARHAGLRAGFHSTEHRPCQKLESFKPFKIKTISIQDTDDHSLLLQHIRNPANQPFNLKQDPLYRFSLIKTGTDQAVLVCVFHHIVVDNTSIGIIARDLGALYSGQFKQPKPPEFKQVLQAAASAMRKQTHERNLNWWRQELADMKVCELPSHANRPAVANYQANRHVTQLSPPMIDILRQVSQTHNLSPFVTGLVLFQLLLHHYTGTQDTNCGTPFANRASLDEELSVGFFASTLVIRLKLNPSHSFRELAAQAAAKLPQVYAHGDIPFHQLVQALAPERDPGRTPLYAATFHFEQQAPLELQGLEVTPCEEMNYGRVRTDLEFYLNPDPNQPRLILLYRKDLFKPARIQALARHYLTLASQVNAFPDKPLGALAILDEHERRQLLQVAATPPLTPTPPSITQLLSLQSRNSPDLTAVTSAHHSLSFSQLDLYANRLAGRLMQRGICYGDRVAIHIPPSLEMLVAIYAVLKSGAAYVPIDTTAPAARIDYIVRDSGVRLMLAPHDEEAHEPPVPILNFNVNALRFYPDVQPRETHPSQPAYIIHTSGSTGKPKGVVVSHGALANLIQALSARFFHGLNHVSTAMTTPIHFDISLHEIAAPALGHHLHIMTAEVRRDPKAAIAFLARCQARVCSLAPPLFLEALLDADLEQDAPNLERISVAGEKVSQNLWDRLRDLKTIGVINFYGPTEATVYATGAVLDQPVTQIGDSLPGYSTYVVNSSLHLCPAGVPGELLIGGASLAAGYWGNPALTASQFVPDPFGEQTGARLYKSGDQVKRENGLEFLGRRDNQLKLRGFRIELGEIETVLLTHPQVTRAAVLCREDRCGLRMIVAYVSGAKSKPPMVSADFLANHLPHYMMPTAIMPLAQMPLTPSGKLDRKALPQPKLEARIQTPPRNPVEAVLTGIWSDILGLDTVGVHDNFFELGGHSLTATRVITRIRRLLNRDLPLHTLFRTATPAATARALATLTDQAPPNPISPLPRDTPLRMSFAQERLWFLYQLDTSNPWYNMTMALDLKGPLKPDALAQAAAGVCQRHESLRTVFPNGQPRVQAAQPFQINSIGLDQSQLASEIAKISARPFDLEKGPLFRIDLLEIAENHHVILIGLHHIISDGWSQGILIRDLSQAYRAALDQIVSPPAQPQIRYVDYAAWQRNQITQKDQTRLLEWWRQKLADPPDDLEPPLDYPRPAQPRHQGATLHMDLPDELVQTVQRAAAQLHLTPFMFLLTAWWILLARHCNQSDITIGTPVANRSHDATENLIGLFVNTLLLRLNGSHNTLGQLLRHVKAEALAAFDHPIPFEKLVETLNPDRDLNRNPLFQTTFALQNLSLPDLDLPQVSWRLLDDHNPSAKFDLSMAVYDGPAGLAPTGLHAALEYDTDLFKPATIARLMTRYQMLLTAMTQNPNQPLAQLPILGASEKRHLLQQGENPKPIPPPAAMAQCLTDTAQRLPLRTALHFEGRELDFQTLDLYSSRLAGVLRDRGIATEDVVAVRIPPSPEMIVAVFAILKAGGVFLPINPKAPAAHTNHILRDAQASLLLCVHSEDDDEPPVPVQTFNINALRFYPNSPATPVDLDNAAYIVYTSGSSGRPKGVVMSHRAVWNLSQAMNTLYYQDLDPGRVIMSGPLWFDVAIGDLTALLRGLTLYISPSHVREDARATCNYIKRHGIQLAAISPPAYLESLLNAGLLDQGPGQLKRIAAGGEKMRADLWARLCAAPITFFNFYGPTETCVNAAGAKLTGQTVHIGQPFSNFRLRITDPQLNLIPSEVIGELLIGGPGLARGYLNRPDLTAAAFVPDPFAVTPGERLYRSGDLVCRRPQLITLGRRDSQLKLRGYRIEPGEIEAALLTHPQIREAAVLLREDRPGIVTLVAYLTLQQPETTAPDMNFLAKRLPQYMHPKHIVTLESLPRTPSGKLDRKALPAPNYQPAQRVKPTTPTEIELAGHWCELLNLDEVGANDDFFTLGGHSLLATALTLRIRQSMKADLALADLFKYPTVTTLAAHLDTLAKNTTITTITPAPPAIDYPLSHAQRRLWTLHQMIAQPEMYNMAGSLELLGPLDPSILNSALTRLTERHEVLRTRLCLVDDEPRQTIAPVQDFNLQCRDLSGLGDPQVEAARLAQAHCKQPFALDGDNLLRIELLRLEPNHHVLCFNQHHIIGDGWSLGLLLQETGAQYQAVLNQEPDKRAPLPFHYKDYAWQQQQPKAIAALKQPGNWWRDKLAGPIAKPDLPYDRPRPPIQTHTGGYHRQNLDPTVTKALKQLARSADTSLFNLLTALLKTLLMRYSGTTDITLGTVSAGRNQLGLEQQLGCYLNTLVLRDELDGNSSFQQCLSQVTETCNGAFEHQHYPFDLLVEELSTGRDLSRSPLFDVLIILHNQSPPQLELPGLTVQPFGCGLQLSKLDLTFNFQEIHDQLELELEYNTDLFDPQTVSRLCRHLFQLAAASISSPQQALANLPYLTSAERTRLLQPNTPVPLPQADLFQMLADRTAQDPDRPALYFEEHAMSYGQLMHTALKLAAVLQAHGVRNETPVGIHMAPSLQRVAAQVAVVACGGCFLPLDPSYPAARLSLMLEDAKPIVIFSDRALDTPQSQIIRTDKPVAAKHNFQPVEIHPQQALYLLYTSGSTGKPKGIWGTHHATLNRLAWMWRAHPYQGDEHCSRMVSLNFVDAVWELWCPLLQGVPLTIVPEAARTDLAQLQKLLAHNQISRIILVPSMLSGLLEQPHISSLKTCFVSGETLPADLADNFANQYSARLINLYGSSEVAGDATACVVNSQETAHGSVPIGSAIDNLTALVLDQQLNPVAPGVVGNLYIGGMGLARGYHNRAPLTASRFIPNPHTETPGARLFQTGDLAAATANGRLSFHGRSDAQIKLRGVRIELGEIEAVLRTHPSVQSAAVLLLGEEARAQLAAYVQSRDDAPVDDVANYLRQRLPAAMIPTIVRHMDAMPLTPNGKLDRAALPHDLQLKQCRVEPRSSLEQSLADIWCEVLGLDGVGVNDNFFELGGNSLNLTAVAGRIQRRLSLETNVVTLFQAPTIATLAVALQHARRQALGPIPSLPKSETWPLSRAQQRLWALDGLLDQTAVYNLPVVNRLSGPLNKDALTAALTDLTARHESLRTQFEVHHRIPLQRIQPVSPVLLPLTNLSCHPEPEQEARRLISEHIATPIPLHQAPLFRVNLYRLSPQSHIICINLHHIISDGWSGDVIARDLLHAYEQRRRNQTPAWEPLNIQYRDYAAWHNARTNPQDGAWWRDHLQKFIPATPLPSKPRPAVMTHNGRTLTPPADQEILNTLRNQARHHGLSTFSLLAGAFQILLHRHSSTNRVVFGTPVAGRNHPDLENQVGFYLNQVTIAQTVRPNQTRLDFLKQVQAATAQAYQHQDYPFDALANHMQQSDTSRAPIFDVMLVLQNMRAVSYESEFEIQPFPVETGFAKYDLTLTIDERGPQTTLAWEYNTDLFTTAQVQQWHRHYLRICNQLTHLDPSIGTIQLMDHSEQRRLLADLQGPTPDLSEPSLNTALAAACDAHPHTPAVIAKDQQWTRRQLAHHAQQLAAQLHYYGIGRGDLVGVSMTRSVHMTAALWAVLDRGAAYLPLDPAFPEHRLTAIVADAKPKLLLLSPQTVDLWASTTTKKLVVGTHHNHPAPPPVRVDPQDTAYVIYTSGSTGTPKGVAVPHRAVINFLDSMQQRIGLQSSDRFLAVTTLSFDIAVLELYLPLLNGATLILADRATASDGAMLAAALNEHAVTHMQATPAGWRLLRAAGEPGPAHLHALCGGEALPADLAGYLLSRYASLHNLYGPTETTVWSAHARLQTNDPVHIGDPLHHTSLRVLDPAGNLCPNQVMGELWIGGLGLARGYWGRGDLTADRFRPDPFSGGGARLYRTGDLAMRRLDGRLIILGRNDHQVKLRGFRIELGEIEAVLNSQPNVAVAAVIVHHTDHNAGQLIAFIQSQQATFDPTTLENWCSERLPAYMVPARFVAVEEMPKTPNAKLDRAALRPPQAQRSEHREPSSPQERILADLWSDILNTETPGVHDSFFSLGGDSISAMAVVTEAAAQGLIFSAGDLFASRTIAALARRAQFTATDENYPVTAHMAAILNSPNSHNAHWELTLDLEPHVDLKQLTRALNQVVADHEALRLRFKKTAGGWRQHVAPPESLRLENQTEPRPFNPMQGPMLQAGLDSHSQRLHLWTHAACIDAISATLLTAQLAARYRGETPTPVVNWRRYAAHISPSNPTPVQAVEPGPSMQLSTAETHALLHQTPARRHATLAELFLAALIQAKPAGAIGLLDDARKQAPSGLDLYHAIGPYTVTVSPQIESGELDQVLANVKTQSIRSAQASRVDLILQPPAVCAPTAPFKSCSIKQRNVPIGKAIRCHIINEALTITLWGADHNDPDLLQRFVANLRQWITPNQPAAKRPEDFPMAGLKKKQLNKLLARHKKR